jgi:gamma-glutamylcyclotransferase (GGCT)/AIG2-like uncharacterized protein YtfP
LDGARFVGFGTVAGQLVDLGDYPGLLPARLPDHRVTGEVHRLRDVAHLRRLDEIEGVDADDPARSLFERERREVVLATGAVLEAWIYVPLRVPRSARPVASGDWAERP